MSLGIRSWPNPEVSFIVYQQVVESYPADFLGVVLGARKALNCFSAAFNVKGGSGEDSVPFTIIRHVSQLLQDPHATH